MKERKTDMRMKKLTSKAASVYDDYKHANHLMLRKKLDCSDVLFRKNQPEKELAKIEFHWDADLSLLCMGLLLLALWLIWKLIRHLT